MPNVVEIGKKYFVGKDFDVRNINGFGCVTDTCTDRISFGFLKNGKREGYCLSLFDDGNFIVRRYKNDNPVESFACYYKLVDRSFTFGKMNGTDCNFSSDSLELLANLCAKTHIKNGTNGGTSYYHVDKPDKIKQGKKTKFFELWRTTCSEDGISIYDKNASPVMVILFGMNKIFGWLKMNIASNSIKEYQIEASFDESNPNIITLFIAHARTSGPGEQRVFDPEDSFAFIMKLEYGEITQMKIILFEAEIPSTFILYSHGETIAKIKEPITINNYQDLQIGSFIKTNYTGLNRNWYFRDLKKNEFNDSEYSSDNHLNYSMDFNREYSLKYNTKEYYDEIMAIPVKKYYANEYDDYVYLGQDTSKEQAGVGLYLSKKDHYMTGFYYKNRRSYGTIASIFPTGGIKIRDSNLAKNGLMFEMIGDGSCAIGNYIDNKCQGKAFLIQQGEACIADFKDNNLVSSGAKLTTSYFSPKIKARKKTDEVIYHYKETISFKKVETDDYIYYGDATKFDTPYGDGARIYKDGTSEMGQYLSCGCLHGRGVRIINGNIYGGNFRWNTLEGWAFVRFFNGDIYIGDFKDNVPNGYGYYFSYETLTLAMVEYTNGKRITHGYIGEGKLPKNDMVLNKCNQTKIELNNMIDGLFDKVQNKPKIQIDYGHRYFQQIVKPDYIYMGNAREDETYDGIGSLIKLNCDTSIAHYKNNLKHGYEVRIDHSGNSYIQSFKNGIFESDKPSVFCHVKGKVYFGLLDEEGRINRGYELRPNGLLLMYDNGVLLAKTKTSVKYHVYKHKVPKPMEKLYYDGDKKIGDVCKNSEGDTIIESYGCAYNYFADSYVCGQFLLLGREYGRYAELSLADEIAWSMDTVRCNLFIYFKDKNKLEISLSNISPSISSSLEVDLTNLGVIYKKYATEKKQLSFEGTNHVKKL